MKSFLEEYGFAILAAIVVILIIALCTPVGNLIKKQVMSIVDSFAGKSESKLAAADAYEEGVRIEQSDIGKIKVIVTSSSTTDKFDVEYRVKSNGSDWQNYIALEKLEDNTSKAHTKEYNITAQDGYSIQARAKNIGKNDNYYMESNVIRYSANFVANSESSQGSSEFQASLDEAKASLNEGEVIQVVNANGGTFPGGESSIWMKGTIIDGELIESYPHFNNTDDFYNYISNATKENCLNVNLSIDTKGLPENEFWEKFNNGEYDIFYANVVWKQINKDSNGIPIPGEWEDVKVYHGNGGALPNGDEIFWVYLNEYNDLASNNYYSPMDFSKEGYILDGFDKDYQGLSEDEFQDKVDSEEIRVIHYYAKWTTELERAINNLDSDQKIDVYRANGGHFPNNETLIWEISRKKMVGKFTTYEFISSNPEFSDRADFENYMNNVQKEGYLFTNFLFSQDTTENINYWDADWVTEAECLALSEHEIDGNKCIATGR